MAPPSGTTRSTATRRHSPEALRTIDEDGIRSFADQPRDGAGDRTVWELARDQPAIAELMGGVMALYSEVLHSVSERRADCCPPAGDHDAVREFGAGYVRVALNDATGAEDARALAQLLPMCVLAGAAPLENVGELAPAFTEDPQGWLGR